MTEKYELDDRAQLLLRQLINSYTRDAQPVGSKHLAELSGLDISSATIRNIMAKLEDMGLVNSPHTSAGRVPTEAGYRFFIDSLLEVNNLENAARLEISSSFSSDKTSSNLIHSAGDILSRVTRRSVETLGLAPGLEVYCVVKSVSVARGDIALRP